jgi:hypothetical protein
MIIADAKCPGSRRGVFIKSVVCKIQELPVDNDESLVVALLPQETHHYVWRTHKKNTR